MKEKEQISRQQKKSRETKEKNIQGAETHFAEGRIRGTVYQKYM